MDLKFSLQFFLLLASIAPHVFSARDLHIHKSSRFLFPRHLVGSRRGHNTEGIHIVKNYLQRYGYLSNNINVETNANAFDNNLEMAIKTYQKFFKLNVSGILDEETLHVMSQPRCAVPDVFNNKTRLTGSGVGTDFEFFNEGKPKWPESKYHLKYAFINNFLYFYKKPVVEALKTWASYTAFKFSEAIEAEADVRISFEIGDHGDGYPFWYREGVLAHAFGPGDGRLHFNMQMSWWDGAFPDSYDVYSVALHEMGHVLGLGHSTVKYAIMYPSIPPNTVKDVQNDDVDGLWELYEGFQGH